MATNDPTNVPELSCGACMEQFARPQCYVCPLCRTAACQACMVAWWDQRGRCECLRGCQVSFAALERMDHGPANMRTHTANVDRLTRTIVDHHQHELHSRVVQLKNYKQAERLHDTVTRLAKKRHEIIRDCMRQHQITELSSVCPCDTCIASHRKLMDSLRTASTDKDIVRAMTTSVFDLVLDPWRAKPGSPCSILDKHGDVLRKNAVVEIACMMMTIMGPEYTFCLNTVCDVLGRTHCAAEVVTKVLELAKTDTRASVHLWARHQKHVTLRGEFSQHVNSYFGTKVTETLCPVAPITTEDPPPKRKRVLCSDCGNVISRDDTEEWRCHECDTWETSYFAFIDGGYHPRYAAKFAGNGVYHTARKYMLTNHVVDFPHSWCRRADRRTVLSEFAKPCLAKLDMVNTEFDALSKTILDVRLSNYSIAPSEQVVDTNMSKKPYFSVIKCDSEGCRGLVDFSETSACISCDTVHCQACWSPLDTLQDHTCDKERVHHVAQVRKHCIQCVACRTVIEKVSGCSHMYCVHCHTGWNDISQDLLTGIVMNPHFFQSMESTRTNEDIPGYTFGGPGIVALAKWYSFTADVFLYHGLCAYVVHKVLGAYATGTMQTGEMRRILRSTYTHIHRMNEVFSGRAHPDTLENTRRWAKKFYHAKHSSQHYRQIMFNWHI